MTSFGRCSILLPTLLCAIFSAQVARAFFFQWPDLAYQCNTHQLYWRNATPPFTAFVIPVNVNANPFVYDIPDDAYDETSASGSYEIEVQLNAGTSYVVLMSDGTGFGTGGSSQIRRVQVSSLTACLYTASSNDTDRNFGFSVSGVAEQCERGFELAWDGEKQYEPYNFTVVPLDQSFQPYDVPLENGRSSMSDWKLNMTSGARFTIMMNNALGYGTGGTAGIYEVDPDMTPTQSACVKQSIAPTGQWPVGLATNTLPVATLPVTAPAGPKKGLSSGEIAGVVIGVVAALAILLLALWFLLRRRRRRRNEAHRVASHEVDLADRADGTSMTGMSRMDNTSTTHVIEPYPQLNPFQQDQRSNSAGSSVGENAPTVTTAGLAGLGAGLPIHRQSHDEDGRASGPGVAGPLPLKTPHRLPEPPTPASSSRPQSAHAMKSDLLNRSPDIAPSLPVQQAPSGAMRIVNHDDPYGLPALPPGARNDDPSRDPRRRGPGRRSMETGPTFRRHEDAGRLPVTRREEEIVDLPPLYTDVPRDGPDYMDRTHGGGGGDSSPESHTLAPGYGQAPRSYEHQYGSGHGQ